jgi:CBS domain-containing protein
MEEHNWKSIRRPLTVYLIYTSADRTFAEAVIHILRDKRIEVLDYQEQVGGRSIEELYTIWNEESDFVLLLATNYWKKLSSYLRGELNILKQYMDDFPDEQRVFTITGGKVEKELNFISYYNVYNVVTPDTLHSIVTQLVEHFRELIRNRSNISSQISTANVTNVSPVLVNSRGNTGKLPPSKIEIVSDIWTPDPISFDENEDISTLSWYQALYHFRHFPVTDQNRHLIGVTSLRDILLKELPDPEVIDWLIENYPESSNKISTYIVPQSIPVSAIMKRHTQATPLKTISANTPIKIAIEELCARHALAGERRYVSSLLAVGENDILEGIVTYIDILQYCPVRPRPVSDIMRPASAGIKTVNETDTIQVAHRAMGDFRDLPVINSKDRVSGMVSQFEIFKNLHDDYPEVGRAPVHLIMKSVTSLPLVKPEHSIEFVIEVLKAYRTLGAIAVLDDNYHLQGIISYIDIFRKMLRGEL